MKFLLLILGISALLITFFIAVKRHEKRKLITFRKKLQIGQIVTAKKGEIYEGAITGIGSDTVIIVTLGMQVLTFRKDEIYPFWP